MRVSQTVGRAASLGLGSVVILACIAYLMLGLIWYFAPYRTLHCPLTVNSGFEQPSGSLSSVVIRWVTWPADKRAVERRAKERGVPVEQIRFEQYCPQAPGPQSQ